MKLFKTTDDRFRELGYHKIKDDTFTVAYERCVTGRLYGCDVEYHQTISIRSRGSGEGFIIESYKSSSNESVPLYAYEIKLLMKKSKTKAFQIQEERFHMVCQKDYITRIKYLLKGRDAP